jgi:hypothetical protein
MSKTECKNCGRAMWPSPDRLCKECFRDFWACHIYITRVSNNVLRDLYALIGKRLSS